VNAVLSKLRALVEIRSLRPSRSGSMLKLQGKYARWSRKRDGGRLACVGAEPIGMTPPELIAVLQRTERASSVVWAH
jgi:hypothetical protein